MPCFSQECWCCAWTGCRRTGGGEPSDQKINVYTSKDYETKDFVAQLGNVDYVGLVEEILANTEPVDSVPDRTPDYIVQILPPKGIEGAITWWFWTDPSGELTLVNASEDKEKAYRPLPIPPMISARCWKRLHWVRAQSAADQLGKQENPEIRWNLRVFMLWRSGQYAPSRTAPQNLSGQGEDKGCPGLPLCHGISITKPSFQLCGHSAPQAGAAVLAARPGKTIPPEEIFSFGGSVLLG